MPFPYLNRSWKAAYLPLASLASRSAMMTLEGIRHTTGRTHLPLSLYAVSEDGAAERNSIWSESHSTEVVFVRLV